TLTLPALGASRLHPLPPRGRAPVVHETEDELLLLEMAPLSTPSVDVGLALGAAPLGQAAVPDDLGRLTERVLDELESLRLAAADDDQEWHRFGLGRTSHRWPSSPWHLPPAPGVPPLLAVRPRGGRPLAIPEPGKAPAGPGPPRAGCTVDRARCTVCRAPRASPPARVPA